MSGELLTWPGSSPTAVSDYQYQNAILAAVIAGFMRLSLTEWATSTIPQIAAGSIVEVGGSMYSFASAVSIAGTPADGTMYIRMEPSGSDANPTWSAVAPSWDMAKNGWYSGSYRYVAKMTRSGSSYTNKELYVNYPAAWIYGGMMQDAILSTAKYIDRSVTTDKIALLAITNALIALGAVAPSNLANYAAGNYVDSSEVRAFTTTSTSYVLADTCQWRMPRAGTVRVRWNMRSSDVAEMSRGKVYVNDVAVGAEWTTSSPHTTDVACYSDISVSIDDIVQIYCYSGDTGRTTYISAAAICCANPVVSGYDWTEQYI